MKAWGKKLAVAVDQPFWSTLPSLRGTTPLKADIAWFVYALELNTAENRYDLVRKQTVYTGFEDALSAITKTQSGDMHQFVAGLQAKVEGREPMTDDLDPRVDSDHEVA